MAVCLNSNYGKTLRISSVPCMPGTMNFCVAARTSAVAIKVDCARSQSRVPAPPRCGAQRGGRGPRGGVWPRARRVCYVTGLTLRVSDAVARVHYFVLRSFHVPLEVWNQTVPLYSCSFVTKLFFYGKPLEAFESLVMPDFCKV